MVQPSPYTPGSPAEYVFGRHEELARIDERLDLMAATRSMVPRIRVDHGPRGVGKTTLLRQVQRMAAARGATTVWVTVGAGDRLLADLVDALDRLVRERGWRAGTVKKALEGLTVGLKVGVPGIAEVTVTRATKATNATPARPSDVAGLKELLVQVAGRAVADRGTGLALFLDELQDADRPGLRVLAHAWQELQSEAPRTPLALFAAGLPSTPSVLSHAVTFTERFEFHQLRPLDPDAAALALARPAADRGVGWDPDALDLGVRHAQGHPHLLQLVGDHAWQAAGRPDPGGVIGVPQVRAAIAAATADLESLFQVRWDRATVMERQVLTAMAGLSTTDPVRRAAVEELAGLSRSQLSVHRDRLLAKGIIESPIRGEMAFTIPGFGDWIARTQEV